MPARPDDGLAARRRTGVDGNGRDTCADLFSHSFGLDEPDVGRTSPTDLVPRCGLHSWCPRTAASRGSAACRPSGGPGEPAGNAPSHAVVVHRFLIPLVGVVLGEEVGPRSVWPTRARADVRWDRVPGPLMLTGGAGSPANGTAIR